MNKLTLSLTLLAFSFMLCSCEESEISSPFTKDLFFDNYSVVDWTAASLTEELKGIWHYQYYEYLSRANGAVSESTAHLDFKIEIKDGEIDVFEEGTYSYTAQYRVIYNSVAELFYLSTEPNIPFTRGEIMIYNNQLLFFDSPVDGADKYWKRD